MIHFTSVTSVDIMILFTIHSFLDTMVPGILMVIPAVSTSAVVALDQVPTAITEITTQGQPLQRSAVFQQNSVVLPDAAVEAPISGTNAHEMTIIRLSQRFHPEHPVVRGLRKKVHPVKTV